VARVGRRPASQVQSPVGLWAVGGPFPGLPGPRRWPARSGIVSMPIQPTTQRLCCPVRSGPGLIASTGISTAGCRLLAKVSRRSGIGAPPPAAGGLGSLAAATQGECCGGSPGCVSAPAPLVKRRPDARVDIRQGWPRPGPGRAEPGFPVRAACPTGQGEESATVAPVMALCALHQAGVAQIQLSTSNPQQAGSGPWAASEKDDSEPAPQSPRS